MKRKAAKTDLILLLIVCWVVPVLSFGQEASRKSLDMEFTVGYNDIQDFTLNCNASVSNWFIPDRFALVTGLGISRTFHDLGSVSQVNGKRYYINNDDKYISQLIGIIGVEYLQPVFKNYGLLLNGSFIFEPIPFNIASFDVYDVNNDDKYKSKWVFTQFNPGYLAKVGFYIDLEKDIHVARFSFGVGNSWQDGLKPYRRVKFDNVRIGSDIKKNKTSFMVFVRLSVYL